MYREVGYVLELRIMDPELLPHYQKALPSLKMNKFPLERSLAHQDSGFDLFTPSAASRASRESRGYGGGTGHTLAFTQVKIDFKVQCAAYKLIYDGPDENRVGYPATWGEMKRHLCCRRVPQAFMMYPRSSLSKTPFRLANGVGIIDSGYRGNLKGVFDDLAPGLSINRVNPLGRLVQICMPDLAPFDVVIVDELDRTARGAGGFGSTGR